MGYRYKSYCSDVGRTYFFDPTEVVHCVICACTCLYNVVCGGGVVGVVGVGVVSCCCCCHKLRSPSHPTVMIKFLIVQTQQKDFEFQLEVVDHLYSLLKPGK